MSPVILLALIVGVPLVLQIILRVKPLFLFISIVTGYLWIQFLGEPAELVLQSLTNVADPDVVARLIVLAIPVVLTLFLMRGSLPASAVPFQFFLLVANSLLLAVFVFNTLPGNLQDSLRQAPAGQMIYQSSDVLVAGIAGLHLLVMWVMRSKADGHHKKRH